VLVGEANCLIFKSEAMANFLDIEKAHQRKIREEKQKTDIGGLFGYPKADIKKAVCKEISYEEAKKIILEYEWLGTMGTTQMHYGIYFEGILAGAICFGYFQAMQGYATYVGENYAKNGIQLSRGACSWWAHEHSASKLIAFGLREMEKKGYKFCIAFSDPDAGEIGTVYQATNWYYLGAKKDTHWDMYYKTGKLFMNDRDIFKKFGFRGKAKQLEYIADKPELEIRLRKPKARYIKLLGNKTEKKQMMKVLEDKILPYHKRNPNGFEKNEAVGAFKN